MTGARVSGGARDPSGESFAKIAPRCVDGRRSRPSIDRRARRKELSSLPRPDRAPYRSPTRQCPLRRHAHGKIERRAQWRARRDRRLPTSARPKIDSLERQATEKLAVQKPARISPTSPSWTGDHACRHRFADDAQSQRVLNWLTVYPYGIANSKRGPRNRRGSRTDDREKQARRSLLASVSSPSPFRAAAFSRAVRRPETKRRCPPWPAPP